MKDCTCPECECIRLREQLRQAQVNILREAANRTYNEEDVAMINSMADKSCEVKMNHEEIRAIAQQLHIKLPMATQEDAENFLITALAAINAKATPVGAAPLPDEVQRMVVDLRCFEHPNHTGESLMQKAADLIERLSAERDNYKAMLKEQWAAGVPPSCVVVPREPTEVMMKAYLGANKAYWFEYDKIEAPIGKWCAGTVQQAFEASYKAMIAAGEVKP